jgi:hypothetical protein
MDQWAKDRAEIESLMHLYARGNDLDSKYYAMCLTDDVEVDYGDDVMKFRGLAQLQAIRDEMWTYDPDRPERFGFLFTQHMIANALIEIEGDTARAQYYALATHGLIGKDGQPTIVPAGCVYTQDVKRTPLGWRVWRHKCRIQWLHDPEGLLPMAQAQMGDPTRLEGLMW